MRRLASATGEFQRHSLPASWQKESVVATLTVLTDGISITSLLTPLAAAALLVFCLLYTPCVAAITSIKRELGGKWAALVVVLQCVIAWLCAFAVHIARRHAAVSAA